MPAGQHDLAATEAASLVCRPDRTGRNVVTRCHRTRSVEHGCDVYPRLAAARRWPGGGCRGRLRTNDPGPPCSTFAGHTTASGVALGDLGRLEEALRQPGTSPVAPDRDSGQAWPKSARLPNCVWASSPRRWRDFSTRRNLGTGHGIALCGIGPRTVSITPASWKPSKCSNKRSRWIPMMSGARYFLGECHLALGEFQQGWAGFGYRQHFLSDLDPARFTAPRALAG